MTLLLPAKIKGKRRKNNIYKNFFYRTVPRLIVQETILTPYLFLTMMQAIHNITILLKGKGLQTYLPNDCTFSISDFSYSAGFDMDLYHTHFKYLKSYHTINHTHR